MEVRRRLAGSWSSTPASSAVDVEAIKQFFADKVANVHQNTSGSPPPTFSRVRFGVGLSFDEFKTNDR